MKTIICIFAFILGAVIASFCGVVIYRVPKGESIIKPDSYCPSCKKPIAFYDNVPIISWLILGGKCRHCKAKIGIESLLSEIGGGLVYLAIVLITADYIDLIFVLPIVTVLYIIAMIDIHEHNIYDVFQIIFAVFSVGYVIYHSISANTFPLSQAIGSLAGFAFFMIIRLVGGAVYKQEALGMGDVILVTIAGFLVGWQGLLILLLVASLSGCVIELIKMAITKNKGEVAFGPYLTVGICVALLFGQNIVEMFSEVIYALI